MRVPNEVAPFQRKTKRNASISEKTHREAISPALCARAKGRSSLSTRCPVGIKQVMRTVKGCAGREREKKMVSSYKLQSSFLPGVMRWSYSEPYPLSWGEKKGEKVDEDKL